MIELPAIPLTGPVAVTVTVLVLTSIGVLAAVGARRTGLRRRTLWAVGAGVGLAAVSWLVIEHLWRPFPDSLPFRIYAAGAVAFFVVGCLVLQKGRRLLLVVPSVLGLVATAAVVNQIYQSYPTLRSLDPTPVSVEMSYAEFRDRTVAPQINGHDAASLVTLPLEATESEFTHRDAIAWIPPAYFSDPDLELPVIVLLAGNPGSPDQWFNAGGAGDTLADYQARHDGVSPIVISVDGTGSFGANPLCIDSDRGQVQTWLAVDVPAGIREKLRVDPDQSRWTIGGLSYGGTCSLQVLVNHPDSYGTFLNYSGQAELGTGDHRETVDDYFGGSELSFIRANPADQLAEAIREGSTAYTGIAGRFVAGKGDHEAIGDLEFMQRITSDAGMQTEFLTVDGSHDYKTWRNAFRETLDFAAQRGGLNR
ncbi:alpha/beta hydrolase [Corynebacterium pygosceleis]|uniref:Alpha/beta hydrolase-fold protein n=1 Tax=Corynebacterium pygosceleis TaxID=2800406 RepID=A0A9Q4C9E5_9CORY|nr:alpha/beta hydrolase-fold protein [Corynebacterium pygosceleis]MCK7638463.1 alpha/beta hydrolase-fold protein [Corynebacterium pygosceleis]MCK7675443.1 alpha/beta hydrolase-fold protein [Corynebacterium pygosceleis]MCL0121163.1 alpha/beta hydrolase-fold protein [Corynebacterium pygosceleis]MCX7469127.1 alpha/beta hydrolase-fold protein [Corynebacterium pygosceleis]